MEANNQVLSFSHLLDVSYSERLSILKELRLNENMRDSWPFFDDLIEQLVYLQTYSSRADEEYVKNELLMRPNRLNLSSTFIYTCPPSPERIDTLYNLAWHACVEQRDIRFLHLISRIGLAKNLRLNRLFTQDIFKPNPKSTYNFTFNTTLPDEGKQSNSKVAEKNAVILQSSNDTFWSKLITGHDLSFPLSFLKDVPPSGERIPIASLIADSINHPRVVGHIYKIEHQAIVPFYSNYLRGLTCLLLLDSTNAIIWLTPVLPVMRLREILLSFIEPLRDMIWRQPVKAQLTDRSSDRLILCGGMNNYGHTIMNEASVYHMLVAHRDHLVRNKTFPMLCEKDYLNSYRVLSRKWLDHEIFLEAERTIVKLPEGKVIDGIVVPLCSHRATAEGLQDCWSSVGYHNSNTLESISKDLLPKAVYWSIGGRSGRRECGNPVELISRITPLLLEYNINHIILDSHTCMPNYSRDRDSQKITERFPKELNTNYLDLLADIDNAVFSTGMNIVDINACSFHQKSIMCKLFAIPLSVVPYGSGLMFPIYFLNNYVLVTGSENILKAREAWKWTITRYCHPTRIIDEIYVESKEINSFGHNVDADKLEQAVHSVLRKL
jgi:hypothetical protein